MSCTSRSALGVYNAIISKTTNGIPFYQLYDAQKTLLRTFHFEIELRTTNQCILYLLYTQRSNFLWNAVWPLSRYKLNSTGKVTKQQTRCIVPKYTVKKWIFIPFFSLYSITFFLNNDEHQIKFTRKESQEHINSKATIPLYSIR